MKEVETTEFNKGWIVGFIENKGVFTKNTIKIKRKTKNGLKFYHYVNPAFYLVSSDISALEIAKVLLGMGKVSRHGSIFHLEIRRKDDLLKLVDFLQGKLKSQACERRFENWKQRVLEWKSRAWGEGTAR
jgi:hypothetical protein